MTDIYNIVSKPNTTEIMLYGDIGEMFNGVIAKQFVSEVKGITSNTINLYINSDGGQVVEALPIYNSLKMHPARVEVDIEGYALSSASFIAMSGDVIRMVDNGTMMIHEVQGSVAGGSDDLRKTADLMDSMTNKIANIYVERTGQNKDTIMAMLSEDTWMDAGKALNLGFIDEITGTAQDLAAKAGFLRESVAKHGYKNIPDDLMKTETPNIDSCNEERMHMDMSLRRMNL